LRPVLECRVPDCLGLKVHRAHVALIAGPPTSHFARPSRGLPRNTYRGATDSTLRAPIAGPATLSARRGASLYRSSGSWELAGPSPLR
jgi:hypothetical protein